MALRTSFDVLSGIVEQFESAGRELRSVEVTAGGTTDGALRVTMEVPVSLCESTADGSRRDLTPSSAAVTDDGDVRVEFTPDVVSELAASTDASVSATSRSVRLSDCGELVLTVDIGIVPEDRETTQDEPDGTTARGGPSARDADDSSATGPAESDGNAGETAAGTGDEPSETDDELAAVRDDSVPPYEDTAYLRRLYETCDTFVEMSRRIEMDVASETVRRYMIEADIHDPASYDTTSSQNSESAAADSDDARTAESEPASGESPPAVDEEAVVTDKLVADGEGLPDGLRMDEVVDAVVESATLFEVQRRLDLDRGPAQELLDRLDLLDLVLHRVADGPKRQVSYEEVTTRIRRCAQTGA